MQITIHLHSDDIFGDSDPRVDVSASLREFESEITDRLAKAYPDSEVVFCRESTGWNGERYFVDGKGRADSPEAIEVAAIVDTVWNSWTWVVEDGNS